MLYIEQCWLLLANRSKCTSKVLACHTTPLRCNAESATKQPEMSEAWSRDTLLLSGDAPAVHICSKAFPPSRCIPYLLHLYPPSSLKLRLLCRHLSFPFAYLCSWQNKSGNTKMKLHSSPWMKGRIRYSEHAIQGKGFYIVQLLSAAVLFMCTEWETTKRCLQTDSRVGLNEAIEKTI